MSIFDLGTDQNPDYRAPNLPQIPLPDAGMPGGWGGGMAMPTGAPEAYPGQSQEQPTPNDFWSRLAESAGPHPFQAPVLGRKPTGLEVILALAAAYGNAKTGKAASNISDVEAKNQRIRQAASDLAKHRYAMRQAAALKAMNPPQVQAIADPTSPTGSRIVSKSASIGQPGLPQPTQQVVGPGGSPVNTTRQAAIGKQPYVKPTASPMAAARYGIGGTPESWVKLVASGQAGLQNVPIGIRNSVADILVSSGSAIVPQKARDTINGINAASALVDKLESLWSAKGVKHAAGAARLGAGLQNAAGAYTQSNTDAAEYDRLKENLSTLARAMGERGVLTDQDVARVKKAIPTLYTDSRLGPRQFQTLRSLFLSFKTRAVQTYTSENPTAGQSGLSDEEAYKRYLQTTGGR